MVIIELQYNIPLVALSTKQPDSEKKIVLVFPFSAVRDKVKVLIESNGTLCKFGFLVTVHKMALP